MEDSARLGLKEYDVIFGEVKEGGDTPIGKARRGWRGAQGLNWGPW